MLSDSYYRETLMVNRYTWPWFMPAAMGLSISRLPAGKPLAVIGRLHAFSVPCYVDIGQGFLPSVMSAVIWPSHTPSL